MKKVIISMVLFSVVLGFLVGLQYGLDSQKSTVKDLNSQLSSAYARIDILTNAQGNVYQWQIAVNELRNKIDDLTAHLEMADKGITKSGTYASEYTR